MIDDCGGGVGIDWHGHRDRDFAVINTLAALEAGATRLHGAAIGIGERVGNTPMELLLMNLVLMGYIERDLSSLVEYCEYVSTVTGVPIPPNYPVVGRDAFRTATGVHAAAVIKAYRKQDRELVDAVYSGVPASLVGREQEIEVGPMSGRSNVVFGSRAFTSHSAYGFWYVIGNKFVTFLTNLLFNAWISDVMTCHKAMRTELFRSLPLRERGFAIEPEIAARVLQSGERIYEVPVDYRARSRDEGKKLTAVDGFRVLRTLLRCRLT